LEDELMHNDDNLFELMTKMYNEMHEGFKEVNSRINKIENDIKDVKTELSEFREETNTRFDALEDKLNEMEAINGKRHLDFVKELKELRHSINRIEVNTAENRRDIDKLKAARKNKIKL